MKIVRILLRILGVLGALLLTLLTLAVSGVNMAMVTQYWVLIVLGGAGLFLVIALLAGVLARSVWKAAGWKAARVPVIIACVFLAQVPLHLLFNSAVSFAVRTYAGQQMAQVEAYHKEQGRYPGTLDEVVKDDGALRKLMGQWASYSVFNERSSYRLSVCRPVASGQYVFSPETKTWETRK
jgi:hypothetical protein